MMALLRNVLIALTLALLPVGGVTLLTPTTAEAQQPPSGPDYGRWESVAKRAADSIEAKRASTTAFESLREQLAEWRSVFAEAQSINSNAIGTLEAQLKALGPAPAEGEEAPGITQQRKALQDQLAEERAPGKEAELAYSTADEMIKSVDRIIRDRQTEELLARGPSPINPVNWSEGASAASGSFARVRSEIASRIAGEAGPANLLAGKLPVAILLGFIGIVLLVRGRFWTELLVRFVRPESATSARWLISFLVSLGEVVVPFIGYMILVQGLTLSGLLGPHGTAFLNILKVSLLIFLVARWLAMRCFPRGDENRLPLMLEAEDRRVGRIYGGALGVIVSLLHFIHTVGVESGWPLEARVVVVFPFMVAAGLLLIRLSRLLSKHSNAIGPDDGEPTEETYRTRLTRLLSRLLVAVAIIAPLLAVFGYNKAAISLLMPSLLSLMMLAALMIAQGVIAEIYTFLTRSSEGSGEDLVPMLIGFVMVLASVPIFALIWGARVADLSELWVSFRRGVTLGDMTISPTVFVTVAVVFAVGFAVTRLLQGTLKTSLLPKTKIDVGGRDAIVSGVGYIGIFLAAIIAVTSAGIDLSSLAIVAGALSVGIGFGLQNIVSNFVSGIILLIERPISQGDWIEVNGQHGTVREISVRSTRIETFDRSDLIIPNADLISGTVTNYTKGSTVGRLIVKVRVAHGTDTKWVEGILRDIARAHPMVLMNPEPTVIFTGIDTDGFDFQVRMILRDINWVMNVTSDINHEIAKRFAQEGIELPYQQRDIWLRNPEALGSAVKGRGDARAQLSDKSETSSTGREGAPQRTADGGDADGADR